MKILLWVALALWSGSTIAAISQTASAYSAAKILPSGAFGINNVRKNYNVTLNYSLGGSPKVFYATARIYIDNHVRLRINGICYSACTLAAEYMYKNNGKICVTERAVFGFHMTKVVLTNADGSSALLLHLIPTMYRREIKDYVAEYGGWREHGEPVVIVGHRQLEQWYDWCR